MSSNSIKTFVSRIVRFLVILLSRIDGNLPKLISIDMNKILGRGGGAENITKEVNAALSLLQTEKVSNLIVFDVGANVGNYTAVLLQSNKVGSIYCFEPSLKTFNALQNRYKENNSVKVIQRAVGKETSVSILYSDSDLSGLASMSKRRVEHFGIIFDLSEQVEVISLTDFCVQIQRIPDFVKIDVEGREMDVLTGAEEILEKIKLIQFEFGGANIDSRTYFQDFWYFFKKHNFDLFRMTPRGLEAVDTYSEEDEYFKTSNYLARNRRLNLATLK